MKNEFKPDGKLRVIHKSGQPYGIRDDGGYLLFFPKVTKYDNQEERYVEEIQESYVIAEKIINALSQ